MVRGGVGGAPALKVVRYSYEGRHGVGIVAGSNILPAGTNALAPVPEGDPIALSALELLPPIGRDAKIVCVGLNYADHAVEGGVDLPGEPLIFAKLPSSLIGPGEPIVLPTFSDEVDFEAELGVVIGRRARRVSASEASDYVFGFTCVNDVSARDLQFRDQQWTRAKSLDTSALSDPGSSPPTRSAIRKLWVSAVSSTGR